LVGGLVPAKFGWGAGYAVASTVKSFPVLGSLFGIGTVAVISGASTYAIGKVFIRHFEEGGTLLSFDSAKAKEHFQEEYEEGVEIAKGARRQKTSAATGEPKAEPA
jgi:uncharacterized protein (DUF697 family)